MPYIDKDRAQQFRDAGRRRLDELNSDLNIGDVAWAVTEDVVSYCEQKGISFAVLNDVVGVLENVKAELRERLLQDYERIKRNAGGDDPFVDLLRKLP